MDITRHWRLKTNRSRPLATRCPATGAVILAHQRGVTPRQNAQNYTFDSSPIYQPYSIELDLAEAAD